ncbi:uncharacterized protein [Spinacia oleracea]|uniref:Uncharacterized protein n=1 Tax=Spinacia oleracea TaxID=3562 RepID=A0A9R0KCF9_SPIOL|nr:uncharacterized protein LOC110805234 [Spinacia oleracea]
MLQLKLNFMVVNEREKYLGLPTYIGRSKKTVFQVIHDRLWRKIKGWKGRCLLRVGKEVLLKSIAQAIPTFAMQCFKLPKGVLDSMNSLCRNFWCGQKGYERKLSLIGLGKQCKSKDDGGLGMRDLAIIQQGTAGQIILETHHYT